jgi:hypothetical protein
VRVISTLPLTDMLYLHEARVAAHPQTANFRPAARRLLKNACHRHLYVFNIFSTGTDDKHPTGPIVFQLLALFVNPGCKLKDFLIAVGHFYRDYQKSEWISLYTNFNGKKPIYVFIFHLFLNLPAYNHFT